MKWILLITAPLLGMVTPAAADEAAPSNDALCVRNVSGHSHVFVAEAPKAGRQVATLAPGERLCVTGAAAGATGVVSVFEHIDGFEGCSRVVPVGQTEDMVKYVDFDRCFWSSNS